MRNLARYPITHAEIENELRMILDEESNTEPRPGNMRSLLVRAALNIVCEAAERNDPVPQIGNSDGNAKD